MADNWWLVMVKGLVGVGIGLAFLAWPSKSALVITMLLGLYVMLDSAFNAVLGLLAMKKDSHWWVLTVLGVVGFLVGVAILNWPQATIGLVLLLLAVWLFVIGIMMLVIAVRLHREAYGSWFFVAMGVLAIGLGLLMLKNPVTTVSLAIVIAGFFVFLSGVFTTAYSFELHHMKDDLKKIEA